MIYDNAGTTMLSGQPAVPGTGPSAIHPAATPAMPGTLVTLITPAAREDRIPWQSR